MDLRFDPWFSSFPSGNKLVHDLDTSKYGFSMLVVKVISDGCRLQTRTVRMHWSLEACGRGARTGQATFSLLDRPNTNIQ